MATHTSAELDLLLMKFGKRVGVEFKRMDASGKRRYTLADRIEVVPLKTFVES